MRNENRSGISRAWKKALKGFTLVELIVVITILAILATVGFLSLSGYSDDARTATVKANVRTVYSAILTESTTSGNSPRYYISHDSGAALSGAFVFVDGKQVALTGGNVGGSPADSNYSAGNPRWDRLRMNGEKFKLAGTGCAPDGGAGVPVSGSCAFAKSPEAGTPPSAEGLPYAFGRFGTFGDEARAAYSTGELAVGAVDILKTGANGRRRATPFFQVAGVVTGSKVAVVNGNYAPGAGAGTPSLIRDASKTDPSSPLVDSAAATVIGDETSGRKWSDGTFAPSCVGYASSPAGKAYVGSTGNGTYWIDPDGAGGNAEFKAYCDMSTAGGGWTLVIKADGYSSNFLYDSAYWTNTGTLNPDGYGFDTVTEHKSPAFSTLPFSEVMLGMNSSGTYRTVTAPKLADSLYSVFSTNVFQPTSLGRSTWKSLVPNSSLQPNCNREWFNNGQYGTSVRFWYIANQENNCDSPDSRIGIGWGRAYFPLNSVGNATGSTENDNGVVDIRSFGFLFIR